MHQIWPANLPLVPTLSPKGDCTTSSDSRLSENTKAGPLSLPGRPLKATCLPCSCTAFFIFFTFFDVFWHFFIFFTFFGHFFTTWWPFLVIDYYWCRHTTCNVKNDYFRHFSPKSHAARSIREQRWRNIKTSLTMTFLFFRRQPRTLLSRQGRLSCSWSVAT